MHQCYASPLEEGIPLVQEPELLAKAPHFLTKQKEDEMLSWAYNHVVVVNGEVANAQATFFPCFELQGEDLLVRKKAHYQGNQGPTACSKNLTGRRSCT